MSGGVQSWPALSLLEGLRPGPDECVELALLASYSADLGTIGATLLALAGKDSDAGRGSPSDFADAVERLRGKVRIIIQRGRLAKMRRTPRIAAVLDQFVREVDFDEAPAERSEFVRLRVSRGDKGLSWLQRAPAEPPFGEDRDRAAFVRFLGARGFLLWLAGLLADDGRLGEPS